MTRSKKHDGGVIKECSKKNNLPKGSKEEHPMFLEYHVIGDGRKDSFSCLPNIVREKVLYRIECAARNVSWWASIVAVNRTFLSLIG